MQTPRSFPLAAIGLYTLLQAGCQADASTARDDPDAAPPVTDAATQVTDAAHPVADTAHADAGTDAARVADATVDAEVPDAAWVPPRGVVGGTRLVARYWRAGPDAAVFKALFDTELGVECTFEVAVDGATRCLPSSNLAFLPAAGDGALYADSACTRPVSVASACETPRYVKPSPRPLGGCPDKGQPIIELHERLPDGHVFQKSGRDCLPTTLPAGEAAFEVAPEVAPSAFVQANQRVDGEGPLAAAGHVAEDGTSLTEWLWDTRFGGCGRYTAAGPEICFPGNIGYIVHGAPGERFTDPACTALAIYVTTPCSGVGAALDQGARELFGLGSFLSSEGVYMHDASGACVVDRAADARDYHPVDGPGVAISDLPPLTTITEGSGRIVVQRTSDPSGAVVVAAAWFFDTQTRQACGPVLEADGYHCQTLGLPRVADYADDACTHPIVRPDESGAVPEVVSVEQPHLDACRTTTELHAIGAQVMNDAPYPVYGFEGPGGACILFGNRRGPYFEIGPQVPTPPLHLVE